ncbi:MAG: hypothetical protein U0325_24835 [Polyangiales bacterium]
MRNATRLVHAVLALGPSLLGCEALPETSPDARTPDARTPDARTPDANTTDASTADVSATDAGPADVSATDAGTPDVTQPISCLEGCPAGMQCFTVGCLPVLPLGARCGLPAVPPAQYPLQCATGSTCAPRGDVRVCVAYGADGAWCRDQAPRCDPGLGCDGSAPGVCRPGVAEGDFCLRGTTLCVAGTSCREVRGVPRCARDGEAGGGCRPARSTPEGVDHSVECEPGLTCTASEAMWGWWNTCARPGAEGDPCGEPGETCERGLSCVAATRRCARRGTLGAQCARATGPRCNPDGLCCDEGLVCEGFEPGTNVCVRLVAAGGACGAGVATRCAPGTACSAEDPAEEGRCVAPGTAPGADCRREGAACDGGLECSNFSRYRSTCREVVPVGGRCDRGRTATTCAGGAWCLAVDESPGGGREGRCVVPLAEQEPNDDPTARGAAPEASTVYAGELRYGDARDCVFVRVAAGRSLRLELQAPTLTYTPTRLQVFDPAGAEVARWWPTGSGNHGPLGDIARFTPDRVSVLRAVAGGVWAACVSRAATTDVLRYALAVSVLDATR